jgi:hypothetical protein
VTIVIRRIFSNVLKRYSRIKFRGNIGDVVNIHGKSQIYGDVFVVEALINISWRNWCEERISKNQKFFEADLTCLHTRSEVFDLLVD